MPLVLLQLKMMPLPIKWYLFSGASDHMVNCETYFTEFRELEQPVKIAVAKQKETLYFIYLGNIFHIFMSYLH